MKLSRVAVAVIVLIAIGVGPYFYFGRSQQVTQKIAPPAEVGVVEMHRADIPLPLTYAGRVAGFRNVEVRELQTIPRVGWSSTLWRKQ
jgi:membrane fusion protein (multidrug efflux system)